MAIVPMVACLLAVAQASFLGKETANLGLEAVAVPGELGPASKPLQLAGEDANSGHYGCATACEGHPHGSVCVTDCEAAYLKCENVEGPPDYQQRQAQYAACESAVLKRVHDEAQVHRDEGKSDTKSQGDHHEEEHDEEDHHEEGHHEGSHHEEGHDAEGHHEEGHHEGGHHEEGHDAEGHHEEGHYEGGHHEEGHDAEGHHEEGHQEGGHHEEGHDAEGHHEDGHHEGGRHEEEHDAEGHHEEGHHGERHHEEGHHREGHHGEGHHEEAGEKIESEEGKEGAEGGEAEEHKQNAGKVWAMSFLATVSLLAILFAMGSTENKEVRNYTWILVDQVIAVFLAVMYFQAFDSLLNFHGLPIHNAVVIAVLHAVLMLAMALALAYYLRKSEVGLAIVCGCGAHVVAFSSMHAGVHMQTHFMDVHYAWYTCIFGLAVLGLGFAFIGYLVYSAKKSADVIEDDDFMEKTDDLENDFGAMSFAVVLTMFARLCLTGHHPEGEEMEFDHTANQRNAMLAYAVGCLIVAVFVVTFVSKKASETDNYAVKRVYNFIKTVATMAVAWAFLYWGEMVFFETLFKDEMTGRVMFAIVSTVVGGLLLLLLSLRRAAEGSDLAIFKSEQMVALTAIGLVVAWSWELTFDFALEQLTEEDAHPAALKIMLTIFLFAVIVPVYAFYVKPVSGPAAEAIGA